MRNYITRIVAWSLSLLFSYLLASLIMWNFNPGDWRTSVRFLVVFVAFVMGSILHDELIDYMKKRAGRRIASSRSGTDKSQMIKS